jgi:hypothetical protein
MNENCDVVNDDRLQMQLKTVPFPRISSVLQHKIDQLADSMLHIIDINIGARFKILPHVKA